MISYLSLGILLGLSAGFAPGPLLVLVISETLQHGIRSGVKIALAPVITDLPIIAFSVLALAQLSDFENILGIISLSGACFIFYLGIKNLRISGLYFDQDFRPGKSLTKGVVVNFFSPHPYLFWLTVGGPTTIRAFQLNLSAACGFVLAFYLLLVGSKIFLAILVGKSRSFLQGTVYVLSMRLLGVVLIIIGGLLFREGLFMLDIL